MSTNDNRCNLAEPVGAVPSKSDVAELFYRHMGEGSEVGFENAIAEALARWGRPTPPAPVAPVSDSKMSAYNHRAAARFAILDRLEKVIDFNSYGWQLTSEGERWARIMAEQGQDECEMGL